VRSAAVCSLLFSALCSLLSAFCSLLSARLQRCVVRSPTTDRRRAGTIMTSAESPKSGGEGC
jgi:hypothetical protein